MGSDYFFYNCQKVEKWKRPYGKWAGGWSKNHQLFVFLGQKNKLELISAVNHSACLS